MADASNEVVVEMQIQRIKQFSFTINEGLFKPDATFNVTIDTKHALDVEKNFIDLTLRITFKYPDTEQFCIQSEISNIFFIKDLKKYIIEGEEDLAIPSNALITIMSLSISHSRALIFSSVGGSIYNGTILPLVNPEEVARQHFGGKVVPHKALLKKGK